MNNLPKTAKAFMLPAIQEEPRKLKRFNTFEPSKPEEVVKYLKDRPTLLKRSHSFENFSTKAEDCKSKTTRIAEKAETNSTTGAAPRQGSSTSESHNQLVA